ncbi:MAG: ATP-binding protein [Marinilabiliales bacterium]|nr:MAG: ATP-binding protein [Marinilabiliales bacterium]
MHSYLKNLIAEGEGQHLDFKFEISDSKKIARTLSAFANTEGGTLLVGVKDNGRIAGVRSDEEYYMLEAAAKLYCKPEVDFTTRQWQADGRTVLEVKIEKSSSPPHFARSDDRKWLAYIRVRDENLLANQVMIRVWKRRSRRGGTFVRYSETEKILFDHLRQNGTISMSTFQRIARINNRKAGTILVNLIVLGLIEPAFADKKIVYKMVQQ